MSNANHNAFMIANAIVLARETVLKVLGGDVASTIDGIAATPNAVTSLVASVINRDMQGKVK